MIFVWAVGYLILINAVSFGAFYFDKKRAQKGGRRISESNLLMTALLGGSVGAITAQQKFRHKTQKQPFKAQLYTIAVLQIVGLIIWRVPPFRAELLALVN